MCTVSKKIDSYLTHGGKSIEYSVCVCQREEEEQRKLYKGDGISTETQRTIRTVEIWLGRGILERGWYEQMSRVRRFMAYRKNYTQLSSAGIWSIKTDDGGSK